MSNLPNKPPLSELRSLLEADNGIHGRMLKNGTLGTRLMCRILFLIVAHLLEADLKNSKG